MAPEVAIGDTDDKLKFLHISDDDEADEPRADADDMMMPCALLPVDANADADAGVDDIGDEVSKCCWLAKPEVSGEHVTNDKLLSGDDDFWLVKAANVVAAAAPVGELWPSLSKFIISIDEQIDELDDDDTAEAPAADWLAWCWL